MNDVPHPKAAGLIFLETEEDFRKFQLLSLKSVIDLCREGITGKSEIIIQFMFNIDSSIQSDGHKFYLTAFNTVPKCYLFDVIPSKYVVYSSIKQIEVYRNIHVFDLSPEDLYAMVSEFYVSRLMNM